MTIKTFTGRRWTLLDPRPEDVALEDIAHALSNQCRFNGHVRCFYSVAQHAVLVSGEVYRRTRDYHLALWGLHHDDEEAYLGDMVKPLKRLEQMSAFRNIARSTQSVILEHFGLSWPEPEVVQLVDKLMLRTEQRDLLPGWLDGAWCEQDGRERGDALEHIKFLAAAAPNPTPPWAVAHSYMFREQGDSKTTICCWQPERARVEYLATHAYLVAALEQPA